MCILPAKRSLNEIVKMMEGHFLNLLTESLY